MQTVWLVIGWAVVLVVAVGILYVPYRRYWKGRHRFGFVQAWRRRRAAAPPALPAADPIAIFGGETTLAGGLTVRIERVNDLVLPTGRIVACDPLVFPETPAFHRAVEPGRYPVDVAVASIEPGHDRVAAARIMFASGIPVRWERATIGGEQGLDRLGYGVDAGVGCFMDAATAALLQQADVVDNYYDEVLAKEFEDPTRDWTDHRPVVGRAENIAIMHSGWGDGFYPSFWGLDTSDRPVWLVTDFKVLRLGL